MTADVMAGRRLAGRDGASHGKEHGVSPLTASAEDLNWLITDFAQRVPWVAHAIAVSADGLPLACSTGLAQDRADHLAAVTSGLASLTQGAARVFEGGPVTQTVVGMEDSMLLVMSISEGSQLAVLATAECDMGLVAYEMAMLVERAGQALTPGQREMPGATVIPGVREEQP